MWERWWSTAKLGRQGERRAASYLRHQGYRLREHSYTCSLGEIDLIAEDAGTLVFVEVKTRASAERGEPWQAVDARKQRKIARVALYYLKIHAALERSARFDVVAITWPASWWATPQIEHFKDAFPSPYP